MIKDKITLNSDTLLEIYGHNNEKLNLIKTYFSKLHINARGNELSLTGSLDDVSDFKKIILLINNELNKSESISKKDLELLLANYFSDASSYNSYIILNNPNGRIIKAKTPNQINMVREAEKKKLLFVSGPAGTGKTYTAVALAVKSMMEKKVKKIILTRPAVESGEHLGFLPGDLSDKLSPYMRPLYDALNSMLSKEKIKKYFSEGKIEIAPLAFMRGRTLESAFVILDEAQNTTIDQMKMFLTRMGVNSQYIICGDVSQVDLPKNQRSGLIHAKSILKSINDVAFVNLQENDVIRHQLVKQIIKAYKNNKNA